MREGKGYRLLTKLGVEKLSPKEYLTQIFNLDKKIDDKIRERDAIMSTLLKGTDSTKEPIYSNLPSSPVENTVIKLMDHNDEVNHQIDELVNLKIQIAGEINQLEKETHKMVLKERYLHCKKFEEIAVEQNYDYRHITRLHGEALKEFEKMFPSKFKDETCPTMS